MNTTIEEAASDGDSLTMDDFVKVRKYYKKTVVFPPPSLKFFIRMTKFCRLLATLILKPNY